MLRGDILRFLLCDHHKRLGCRSDADGAFLILDLEAVSDVKAELFELFAFHLDLGMIGVAAAIAGA